MTLRISPSIAMVVPALCVMLPASSPADQVTSARQQFTDRRSPPAWHALPDQAQQAFDLGQLVFNTTWVPAGTANAGRRDGLGPLFVLGSCDGCHNNGARGRGEPQGDGLPSSFVMQLGGPSSAYGAVLNTQALAGHTAEGVVSLRWTVRQGRYADGSVWQRREPHYSLTNLAFGDLPRQVVLRPRIGPALFGTGLLEAVPASAIETIRRSQPYALRGQMIWHEMDGKRRLGRFGWQSDAVSIEDQTARALAREMGLTSHLHILDDCSLQQPRCREAPNGGVPEVSEEFFQALVTYQRELAVPARATGNVDSAGERLFNEIGCATCHRPSLTASLSPGPDLKLDAYTDLMLHDLGDGLADRTAGGTTVKSSWRTAPLWGMAHAITNGDPGLLHNGRARSVEEAILWHDGQARGARLAFGRLPATDRQALLSWVGSL